MKPPSRALTIGSLRVGLADLLRPRCNLPSAAMHTGKLRVDAHLARCVGMAAGHGKSAMRHCIPILRGQGPWATVRQYLVILVASQHRSASSRMQLGNHHSEQSRDHWHSSAPTSAATTPTAARCGCRPELSRGGAALLCLRCAPNRLRLRGSNAEPWLDSLPPTRLPAVSTGEYPTG